MNPYLKYYKSAISRLKNLEESLELGLREGWRGAKLFPKSAQKAKAWLYGRNKWSLFVCPYISLMTTWHVTSKSPNTLRNLRHIPDRNGSQRLLQLRLSGAFVAVQLGYASTRNKRQIHYSFTSLKPYISRPRDYSCRYLIIHISIR